MRHRNSDFVMKFRIPFSLLVCAIGIAPALAQRVAQEVPEDEPLAVNRERDAMGIAEQLYVQSRAEGQTPEEKNALRVQAEKMFADFVKKYPKSSQWGRAQYFRATCMMEMGQINQANAILAEVATKSKGEIAAAAAYKLASQCAQLKDWEKARRYYEITFAQATNAEMRNDARYRIGRAYMELGNRSKAQSIFQELTHTPHVKAELKLGAFMSLAHLAVDEGNSESAYGFYRRILSEREIPLETRSSATLQAARLAAKLGRSAESQELYHRLSNMPGMEDYASEAALETILLLYRDKNYTEIAARASAGMPPLADKKLEAKRCRVIGQALYEIKQYERAMQYFAAAEASLPGTAEALDASYRRIVCASESFNPQFMQLALRHLNTYAGQNLNRDNPLNDIVRLMYAERMLLINPEEAARQYAALRLQNIPEKMRSEAAYKCAWSLVQTGSPESVVRLDAFIHDFPQSRHVPEAFVLRGMTYHSMGKDDLALADFKKVITDYPKSEVAATAWQRAAQTTAGRDNDAMIYFYEGLIKNFPSVKPAALAEAHYALAKAYYERRDGAKAVLHFKEAGMLNKDQYGPLADANLVHCYYMMQDLDHLREAVEYLQRENKASFDALPLPILTWLGWTSFQKKDYITAERYLNIAVDRAEEEIVPGTEGASPTRRKKIDASVWKALAKSCLMLDKYWRGNMAIDQYLSMESQPYRRVEGMKDKAELLLGTGQTADARQVAEAAIGLGIDGPLKSALYIVLGDTYFVEKNYSEASKNYGRVANVISDPEMKPAALYKLIIALKKANKPEETSLYEKMLSEEFPSWTPDERLLRMTE